MENVLFLMNLDSQVKKAQELSQDTSGLLFIAGIMLFAGLLGATVSYVFENKNDKLNRIILFRYIIISLGATTLVPLFLKIGDSQLIKNIALKSSQCWIADIFALFGFCMVAAIYAKRFIDSVADKVLRQVEESKKEIKKTNKKLETETEKIKNRIKAQSSDVNALLIASSPERDELIKDITIDNADELVKRISGHSRSLLKEIALSERTFFTINFLKKHFEYQNISIPNTMQELEDLKLVSRVVAATVDTWYLTLLGQSFTSKHVGLL